MKNVFIKFFIFLIVNFVSINIVYASNNLLIQNNYNNYPTSFSYNQNNNVLTSDEAFNLQYRIIEDEKNKENKKIEFYWQIAKDYHLYKKELKLLNDDNKLIKIEEKDIKSSPKQYLDKVMGQVEIFDNQLIIEKPLKELFYKEKPIFQLSFQGCNDNLCYPAKITVIDLNEYKQYVEKLDKVSETNKNNLELNILAFFILGIGLSFTPCVLPMLPLLSSVILNNNEKKKTLKQNVLLTLSYIQGMAITYTLLGLLVALFGLKFSIFLQNDIVLLSLSVIFILLSLINFGLLKINISIPFISDKINQLNYSLSGGSYIKTFIMGIVAGLVASPCTSAPLSGILLYIAQEGDIIKGALSLYLLALGIGFPLLLISIFGKSILPKSGNWLNEVKILFGFILLLFPAILLTRVFNQEWLFYGLWGVLFSYWLIMKISKFIFIKNEKSLNEIKYKKLTIYFLHTLFALSLLLFAFSVNKIYYSFNFIEQEKVLENNKFKAVENLKELNEVFEKNNNYKFIYFYADWCSSCKEYEKMFKQEKFYSILKDRMIKINFTNNSKDNEELMKRFNVIGLPTILMVEFNNNEISEINRINGLLKEEEILNNFKQNIN